MENTCTFSQYGLNMEYVPDMAGKSCKQTEVGEVEEQILHLSSGCSFISESFSRSTRDTLLQLFLGAPSLKHQTLCLCRQAEREREKKKSVRPSFGNGAMSASCTDLMPAKCVRAEPQMTVRAGVRLLGHLLVPVAPAGPLAAPQGATRRMGGPRHAEVRSGVCLVAHFLATGGRC